MMPDSRVPSGPRPTSLTQSGADSAGTGTMTEADLSLYDIIFACTVCRALPSEIYGGEVQPSGLDRRPITKLYLTECAHVICAKHFDGGGVPFHPMNKLPQAPCPCCRAEKHDDKPKALYAIRDHSQGGLDPYLPKAYSDIPPKMLYEPGMDALQFQYGTILRFAQDIYAKMKHAQIEAALAKESVKDLEKRINPDWQGTSRKVDQLASILKLRNSQLKRARDGLQQLGQDVTWIDEALSHQNIIETGNESSASTHEKQRSRTTNYMSDQSRLAQGSAADQASLSQSSNSPGNALNLANLDQSLNYPGLHSSTQQRAAPLKQHFDQSRSEKRKRSDTGYGLEPAPSRNDNLRGNNQNVSRDAMPPPQLPVRASMPMQAPTTRPEAVRSSNDRRVTALNPSVSDRSFNSQHEATSGPTGTHDYPHNPSHGDQQRAAKLPKHTQASTQYGPTGQECSYKNLKGDTGRANEQSSTYDEQPFHGHTPGVRGFSTEQAAEDADERVRRASAMRRIRDRGGFVEDAVQNRNPAPHYYRRTIWSPELFLSASGRVTPTDPRPHPVPGTMTNPFRGRHVTRPSDDGELDQFLQQPTPQRPVPGLLSISPTRGRITLPPTPRNTSSSIIHRNGSRHLPLNQNSLLTSGLRAQSAASHRQQLGQPSTTNPFVAQSPYFATRTPSPQRPPLGQSHGTAESLSGPSPLTRTPAPRAYPGSHATSPQRQEGASGTDSSETDVSYLGQLPAPHENQMGRRRARR